MAFVAAARAVWGVLQDQHDKNRRFLLPVKRNLSKAQDGLAYAVVDAGNGTPQIAWEPDPVSIDIDEALAGEPSSVEEVAEFRREILNPDPMGSKELKNAADTARYSWSTVKRAKAIAWVDVIPERTDNRIVGWYWKPKEI